MLKKFKEILLHFFQPAPTLEISAQTIEINGNIYFSRQLSLQDAKVLFALEEKVYYGQHPWTQATYIAELQPNHRKIYLGIFAEDALVGFVGCRLFNIDCHITNIAVHPDWQAKGLGAWLIDEAEKFAIMWHCETMSLEVRVSNKAAQRLYRRKGFVSRKVKYNYYDENHEDALDMVKYL